MSGVLTDTSILAGASGAVSGYDIDNSCRFNADDDSELTRSPGTPTSTQKGTISVWTKFDVKLSPAAPADYDWCGIISNYSDNDNRIYFAIVNRTVDEYYLIVYGKVGGSANIDLRSTMSLRDPSAWYHLVVSYDTTQVTAADRIKIYVNGVQVTAFDTETYPAQNAIIRWNGEANLQVGRRYAGGSLGTYNGYLTEFHYIDGQALTTASFGETNEDTNQWVPIKYAGTYGDNGFFLEFKNSAALGTDTSGNGNNFTPTNVAATDQVPDSPTNNFSTMNPLPTQTLPLSEGNLWVSTSVAESASNTIGMESGKWYFEMLPDSSSFSLAIINNPEQRVGASASGTVIVIDGGADVNTPNSTEDSDTFTSAASGDIYGFALDVDAKTVDFYQNNTKVVEASSFTIDPPYFLGVDRDSGITVTQKMNFGADSSFAGQKTAQGNQDGNSKGDFYYAPPSGYLALCTDNLPTPSIELSGENFNTHLYTGNDSAANAQTGIGFQPDLVWIKERDGTAFHSLFDSVRGRASGISSNDTMAASTSPAGDDFASFDSDGFTVGEVNDWNSTNKSGALIVAWNWKAGGTPTVDNSAGAGATPTAGSVKIDGSNLGSALAGTIAATRLSANTTSGFSIVNMRVTGAVMQRWLMV